MKNGITDNITVSIDIEKEKKKTKDAVALCEVATELVVTNQEQLDTATGFLKQIKAKYKDIDTQRKEITKPLDEAKKNIMNFFNPVLTALEEAERKIKSAIAKFTEEQERKAREEQERLQRLAEQEAEKERKKLEAKIERAKASGKLEKAEELETQKELVQPVVPVIAPNVEAKGVSFREKWYAVVVDEKLVPREYMIIDQSKLDKVAQATKGTITIPGVKFEMKKIVVA